MLTIGQAIPTFTATAVDASGEHESISNESLSGQYVVLYFYPKDNTPGCTTEGQDFRDNHASFVDANCRIIGVSRDSLRVHANFINKQSFPFSLLSDPDEVVCKAFDVIKEKTNYGKTYMGIERSTFIIGPDGTLLHEWRKVRVKEHVADVLATLQGLQA